MLVQYVRRVAVLLMRHSQLSSPGNCHRLRCRTPYEWIVQAIAAVTAARTSTDTPQSTKFYARTKANQELRDKCQPIPSESRSSVRSS